MPENPKVVLNRKFRTERFLNIKGLNKINKLSRIVHRDLSFQRLPEILVNVLDINNRVTLKGKLKYLTNFMEGNKP